MVSSNFPGRPFRLEENVWVRYQDVGANKSNVGAELWIRKNSTSPTYSNNRSSFTFFINGGQVAGWDFTFDFRNSDALRLSYSEVDVYHNADGTKTFSIDGYCNADSLGYTEVHSSLGMPTIPRASTASFTSPDLHSLIAGQVSNVAIARASSAFTHNIDWYFGNATGRAMTNVGDSGSWVVPMETLNQIPDSPTGVGTLRTHTYSGGNMIGWTEAAFRITAAADVIPTWTSASVSEAVSAVSSVMGSGRYVQGISKLSVAITGAAGVYGSSITGYAHTAGSETLTSASGTFTQPLTTAGTAVPVVQRVTDSRGRSKSQTTNINVLPYSTPVVTKANVERVNGAGATDPVGTRLKVSITAAVQSLINSSERNRMTLRVYTKAPTSSSWGTATAVVTDTSTLSYNSDVFLEGPFSVAQAYDVRVELIDKFNTTRADTTLATGEVFQHWSTGMGVGKYWERGMLDVNGDIYHGGGALVDPIGSVVAYTGTAAPTGWLLCQGQAISRTTYAKLYAVIGTSYGSGNGSSTFNLPDLRGRVIVGVNTGDTDFTRGKTGGAKTVTLGINEMPSHSHPQNVSANPGTGGSGIRSDFSGEGTGLSPYDQGISTQAVGGGAAHNNLQPYGSLNYIIRVL